MGGDWPPPPGAAPTGGPPPAASAPGTAAAPGAPPPAATAPDPFSGRFATQYDGALYTLELKRTPSGYSGVVVLAGERYPISGNQRGDRLVGRFRDPDGSEYGYAGRREGRRFVFETEDGETIVFEQIGG
ncbi:MAG: hypothetical protein AAF430_15425 [Myxococcota bacterium]